MLPIASCLLATLMVGASYAFAADLSNVSNHTWQAAISGDGRVAAFTRAPDNDMPRVYYRELDGSSPSVAISQASRQLDTIKRISVSSNGAQSNHSSFSPDISADGRYVVFASFASNLSSVADSSDGSDVFLHDTVTGSTRQVSVDSMGRDVDGSQGGPVISANGNFIAYSSNSTEIVTGAPFDVNGDRD